jgi:hypothetical protein
MFQSKISNARCSVWRAQSQHSGIIHVAMMDGSVHAISYHIASREDKSANGSNGGTIGDNPVMGPTDQVWDHLMLPADGETPGDW